MANSAFTRDEVILALDVLYFSGEQAFTKKRDVIIELSDLLKELPIHTEAEQAENFRNPSGISTQITHYLASKTHEVIHFPVGKNFRSIDEEFEKDRDLLHAIAVAIRRNAAFFEMAPFGADYEDDGFKEGALLGHLHKAIEQRDSVCAHKQSTCEVCKLNFSEIYKLAPDGFAQLHLLTPIVALDANHKYGQSDFITVCPNCHAVLHHHRPWATRENAQEILR